MGQFGGHLTPSIGRPEGPHQGFSQTPRPGTCDFSSPRCPSPAGPIPPFLRHQSNPFTCITWAATAAELTSSIRALMRTDSFWWISPSFRHEDALILAGGEEDKEGNDEGDRRFFTSCSRHVFQGPGSSRLVPFYGLFRGGIQR